LAGNNDTIPTIAGLAVGITFIVLFSLFASSFDNRQPAVSTVVFVEGASLPDAPKAQKQSK
jgi:hypothetical protein